MFTKKIDEIIDRALKGEAAAGNLYANQDLMKAYQILCNETPLIRFCHDNTNQSIDRITKDEASYTILDLGIGTGAQWLPYVEAHSHQKISLIGVDLDTEQHRKNIKNFQDKMTSYTHLRFRPILSAIENLDFTRLEIEYRPLIVNAALVLHHILPKEHAGKQTHRDEILNRIAWLKPKLLCLVEPESDHNSDDAEYVLREARGHYATVFDLLEHHLDKHPSLDIIQRCFFGKEICNILNHSDDRRIERHERFWQWQRRLELAGFSLLHKNTLDWKGTILLVCSAWTQSSNF